MSDKQIFAALEISDHEVRMVIGEFYNTRFNIIKVERIPCFGLSYKEVTDEAAIIEAIKKASAEVKKTVGSDVRKVLLSVPSYRFRRYSVKVSIPIDGLDKVVTVQDIRNAVDEAAKTPIPKGLILVQPVCVRFTANGISTRRIPIGEHCTTLNGEIDLLCADQKLIFDLVGCVEKSGLQVLDIFPDVYCAGKEAALFEQSIDRQVIILKVERDVTTLGLLRHGRLTTAAIMPAGIGSLADGAVEQFHISRDLAVELLKYSVRLDQKKCSDNPIHIWSDQEGVHTISEQQMADCVRERTNGWIDAIVKTCEPILQAGETAVIITGEGGETEGLSALLQDKLGVETKCYIPETLGGRNAGLSGTLGLFYAYQDKMKYAGYVNDSLDMSAFDKAVDEREKKKTENREDTLTNKLKGLFLDNRK